MHGALVDAFVSLLLFAVDEFVISLRIRRRPYEPRVIRVGIRCDFVLFLVEDTHEKRLDGTQVFGQ